MSATDALELAIRIGVPEHALALARIAGQYLTDVNGEDATASSSATKSAENNATIIPFPIDIDREQRRISLARNMLLDQKA
jgi:hypothetical protein